MDEAELFLLIGIRTEHFNTMNLLKVLEINQKLHIYITTVTLKVTLYEIMRKKRGEKK
jgi:hypothetical protein